MGDETLGLLEASREREKAQALFYRTLAARAEAAGDEELADRFYALHADEQHHLSRLTARVLELGASPAEPEPEAPPSPEMDGWEDVARAREEAEVAWYQEALGKEDDPSTRKIFQEILESEEHHARELGGKWMPA